MILGVSSYITSAGLKAITSAGALGPYFAIKYFLPIYDFRIDKTICRGTSGTTQALSISGLNLVSATDSTLVGERLFYNGSYTMTSGNNYIYYDSNLTGIVQGGSSTVLGSKQSVSTNVNMISGLGPVSHIVSGSSVIYPNAGTFFITDTNNVAAAAFNPISGTTPPISAYYRVQSYSPKNNGITNATGTYKCRIPSSGNGTFKFNGLAIYATKVNETGFDDNGYGVSNYNFKPVLFAVVLFDQAQTKQDSAGGVNDFEINVDLGFDWTTYNTSGAAPVYVETNYWTKMPSASTTSAYGLSYDGDIVIASSAVPGSWTPRAKLTVTDKNKEQLRLANDDDRFVDFRSYRFAYDNTSATMNSSDKTVLDIDTSCPDDSLIQLGLNATALGIKSVAIGCYSSAVGYLDNNLTKPNAPTGDYAGGYTTSIGINTLAGGFGSFAVGDSTSAYGRTNFAGGKESVATCHNGLSTSNNEQFWDNADSIGADCNIAYGYMTSAISRSKSDTPYNYNVDDMSALDDSCGGNVAFGVQTFAGGGGSVATGLSAQAHGVVSVSMGLLSRSMGIGATSFGLRSNALGNFSLAHGCDVVAGGGWNGSTDNLSLGQFSYALAIGEYVSATEFHSIAIGRNVKSTAMGAIAIGTALGQGSVASWTNRTEATGIGAVAIGPASSATGYNSYAIGGYSDDGHRGPLATGNFSFALGTDSISTDYLSFAFGAKVSATGSNSVAFGNKVAATGSNSYAFGNSLNADGSNSFAFGNSMNVKGSTSFGFGSSMSVNGAGSYGLGYSISVDGDQSYGIGHSVSVKGDSSHAIGYNLTVNSDSSILLGNSISTDSTSKNVIAIGKEINIPNGTTNSIFIGSCSSEKTAIAGANVTIGGTCTTQLTLEANDIKIIGNFNNTKYHIIIAGNERDYGYVGRTTATVIRQDINTNTKTVTGKVTLESTGVIQTADEIYKKHSSNAGFSSLWLNMDTGVLYLLSPLFKGGAFQSDIYNDIPSISADGTRFICLMESMSRDTVYCYDYVNSMRLECLGNANNSDNSFDIRTDSGYMIVKGLLILPSTSSGPINPVYISASVLTGTGNGNARIMLNGSTVIQTGSGNHSGNHDASGSLIVSKYFAIGV